MPQLVGTNLLLYTDTMRSKFAQQDHLQVSKSGLDCLDFLMV